MEACIFYIFSGSSYCHLDWHNSSQQVTMLLSLLCCNLFSTWQLETTFKSMLEYITPLFKTLQWLPISLRVKVKWGALLSPLPHLNHLFVFISSCASLCWICCSHINPLMFFKTTIFRGPYICLPSTGQLLSQHDSLLISFKSASHVTCSMRLTVTSHLKWEILYRNTPNSHILFLLLLFALHLAPSDVLII